MICLQHAELISHKSQIEHLELLIAKLRRMQFGRSSELFEPEFELFDRQSEIYAREGIDASAVWFAYSPDHKGEHPQRHLTHFRGILQADA
jgi:hypothetical protein